MNNNPAIEEEKETRGIRVAQTVIVFLAGMMAVVEFMHARIIMVHICIPFVKTLKHVKHTKEKFNSLSDSLISNQLWKRDEVFGMVP